jgi:hypothetical protein
MPHEEPANHNEEPAIQHQAPAMPPQEPPLTPGQPVVSSNQAPRDSFAPDTAVQAESTNAYEPVEDRDDWPEPAEELPRRPRRRILSPIPLALLGVLIGACGFIAGVLVEKGQTSPTPSAGSAASLASRLAALRGGASAVAGGAGSSPFAGAAGATSGSVEYLSGTTLYLTTAEGNTVKVTTSPGTAVTKTVKANVAGIHPGESVLVTGTRAASGTIKAETIRVGAGLGGGFGALFGGSRPGSGRAGGGAGPGGEQSLFGPG